MNQEKQKKNQSGKKSGLAQIKNFIHLNFLKKHLYINIPYI